MNKSKLSGSIVKQYLEIYPKVPALTLAKKIYAENKEVFTNVEHARTVIRYHIGQLGDNRNRLTDRRFVRDAGKLNPYALPESDAGEWLPVKLPESYNKILCMSDLHIPYQDNVAITAMLDHASGRKINTIVINGDAVDFYRGSRFVQDPRKRSINDELWDLVEFLNILQHTFPGVPIVYKIGNHDERLEIYLKVKAPELLDMNEFRLSEILRIRGIEGVQCVEKQLIYAGRLPLLHGHEYGGFGVGGVNPARGLALRTFSSALVGHGHRTSSHSERDINDKVMSWFSIGCLCNLHPEYAILNKWNQGFCYIDTEGQEFAVNNFKIHKGKVYSE